MRNRNRKGPNPLTKTYESNGPDGKIRGTALSIAEKYIQASRDASAAGDRIKAENLLQHAEHYNRIVAAAQAHNQPAPAREQDTRSEPETTEDALPQFLSQPAVSDPDTPQPVVDHSQQLANGVANGKIPNGVKVEVDGAEPAIAIETEDGPVEQTEEAPAPRRRARGRPRTPRRPPLQPSAIVAEVSNRDGEKASGDSSGSDTSET
ncbi:MAG: DUF4167 domain-containing protein [Pseudomonadota bacterium]